MSNNSPLHLAESVEQLAVQGEVLSTLFVNVRNKQRFPIAVQELMQKTQDAVIAILASIQPEIHAMPVGNIRQSLEMISRRLSTVLGTIGTAVTSLKQSTGADGNITINPDMHGSIEKIVGSLNTTINLIIKMVPIISDWETVLNTPVQPAEATDLTELSYKLADAMRYLGITAEDIRNAAKASQQSPQPRMANAA